MLEHAILQGYQLKSLAKPTIDIDLIVIVAMSIFADAATKQKFDGLYDRATKMSTNDTQMVTICYDMIDLLKSSDNAYEDRINPLHMGIHPRNRGGKKMPSTKKDQKGSKIVKVGFNMKLCGPEKAIGFENHPVTKHIEKHTISTTAGNQFFAQYKPGAIRAGSVGCTHLNQYLAGAIYGARTHFPRDDICESGTDVLSKKQMSLLNRDIEDALNHGIVWTIIKWPVEIEYESLPDIFQRALNIEHHIGEGHRLCFVYICCFAVSIYRFASFDNRAIWFSSGCLGKHVLVDCSYIR